MTSAKKIFVIALMLIVMSNQCLAMGDFDKIASVVTDPLKVGSSSDNLKDVVREAKAMLLAVQNEFDMDIQDYLDNIDDKIAAIDQAVEGQIRLISHEIKTIEGKIFQDALLLMDEARCVALGVSDNFAQDIRNTLPAFLKEDKRVIELPFGEESKNFFELPNPFSKRRKTFDIDLSVEQQPNVVFNNIEEHFIANIETMTFQDSPKNLFEAYNALSLYAKTTQCHFPRNSAASKSLFKKFALYNYKAEVLLQAGFSS